MKSLKDYIYEAKYVDTSDYELTKLNPKKVREVFSKLDDFVKQNNYIYFASDREWPGTTIEGWGTELEKFLETHYIHIDGEYARTDCDVKAIQADSNNNCLNLLIDWGDNMRSFYGHHEQVLSVYILKGEVAECLISETSGCRNSSRFTGFEKYPDSKLASMADVSATRFKRIVTSKKNLVSPSEYNLKI